MTPFILKLVKQLPRWLVGCLAWHLLPVASAQVRLNEIVAAPSERLLAPDEQGRWRPGTGAFWADKDFTITGWQTGKLPIGYGTTGLGTNVQTLMRDRTPTLYLRKHFSVSESDLTNEGQLRLQMRFDDGFVAYLNGREVARANAGPPGHHIYYDQPAYNFASPVNDDSYTPGSQPGVGGTQPMTIPLGRVTDWLTAGDNVLAVQLLNREPGTRTRLDAMLEIVQGTAILDVRRFDFDDANDAKLTHRNTAGDISNDMEGVPPVTSWLAEAPLPKSSPNWGALTLTTTLAPGLGVGGSGALQYEHTQTGPNHPAMFYGPTVSLRDHLTPGAVTASHLENLTVQFRFRATSEVLYQLRLEPEEGDEGNALTGLPPLTPAAGTAAAESAPTDFANAAGAVRTRTVTTEGEGSTLTEGSVRQTLTLFHHPAARDFAFKVIEDNTPGAGAGGATGHLTLEVTRAAAHPDAFGFTLQTFQVRSWPSGAIEPEDLRAVVLQAEAKLPEGLPLRVFLEPSTTGTTATDQLDLGLITGSGEWAPYVLHPSAGSNVAAFLARMNGTPTRAVRVGFRCETIAPVGTRWEIDNVGFVPWRSYSVSLSAGSNAAAFLSALNIQTTPRFIPVFQKTGSGHASVVIDDFAVTYTRTNAGSAQSFIPFSASEWSYWPGLAEPSGGLVDPADFSSTEPTVEFSDWIELLNTGTEVIDLTGWSLTDDPTRPQQWTFPAGTQLAPGTPLVVLADGRDAPAGATYLHANFSLAKEGEYLALIDAAGVVRDAFDPAYPPQDSFHSYGRNETGVWGYFRQATPGTPNLGPWTSGRTEAPEFSPEGGFHSGAVTLTLHSPTEGAIIRYTTDGSEPEANTGLVYTAPVRLEPISNKAGTVIRARAFKSGLAASETRTHTYLMAQHANLRDNPALVLSGDPGRVFYAPLGLLAIQGGNYDSDNRWRPVHFNDYNIPVGNGRFFDGNASSRPYERMVQFELLPRDDERSWRGQAGLRVSSSPWSRPQLRLTQARTASPLPPDPTQKPSFNVFFRSDYGTNALNYPLIPETSVRSFEELRLRAGKNDISNPFIRDELVRRLYADMGQVSAVGSFVSLYLNAVYKGYYNAVSRLREPFFQSHHRSAEAWDVNYIGTFENGDDAHFTNVLRPRLQANLAVKANYDRLAEVLDLTNAADYFLLNIYAAMWDWPQNNWAMARERSPQGQWRYYVWDAEGGFNMGGHGPSYNMFTSSASGDPLLGGSSTLSSHFQRLMTSAEWRLLFADRIQKHFFNGGALTDARLNSRKNACQEEVRRLMAFSGLTPETNWFTSWLNASSGRKRFLFPRNRPGEQGYQAGQWRDPNGNGQLNDTLWPLTLAPTPGLPPGEASAGATLALSHEAPVDSVIYYTLNGKDPREWGGTVAPSARTYTEPLPLTSSSVVVKARVKNGATGEWSPLLEAAYRVGAVPASAANLVVSELMYHPPAPTAEEVAAGFDDADFFEFLALRNIGTQPIDLSQLRFVEGIVYDFSTAAVTVLDPGRHVILGRSLPALRQRYGPEIKTVWAGGYFGGLANSGETLRLESLIDDPVVKEFTYGDDSPWPEAADGQGASLVLTNAASNPDHNNAAHWHASTVPGGTPLGETPLSPTYATWAADTFTPTELTDPAISGPLADPDGDGWANYFEFALSSSPNAGSDSPQVTWHWQPLGDNQVELEVEVRQIIGLGNAAPRPAWSDGLTAWQADFTLVSTTPEDGREVARWRKTFPAGSTQIFVRLQASTGP